MMLQIDQSLAEVYKNMSEINTVDHLKLMRQLFLPGPVILFVVGLINVIPTWLLITLLAIFVPCSLIFFVTGLKAWRTQKGL